MAKPSTSIRPLRKGDTVRIVPRKKGGGVPLAKIGIIQDISPSVAWVLTDVSPDWEFTKRIDLTEYRLVRIITRT